MRIAYWIGLALGIALTLHVIVFGLLIVVLRLTTTTPMDCQPLGFFGFGCGSAADPSFLFEGTLAIRALVGGFLAWAFFRHRRDGREGA